MHACELEAGDGRGEWATHSEDADAPGPLPRHGLILREASFLSRQSSCLNSLTVQEGGQFSSLLLSAGVSEIRI